MSFDKPSSSGDDDPGTQYERRPFNPDLSKPMPDWMKPGYADRRSVEPDRPQAIAMQELKERRTAFGTYSEYEQARDSGFFDSDAWKNRHGPVTDKPDGDRPPEPLQAEVSPGNGEGTRAAGKIEVADRNAERAEKAEGELAETRTELAETKTELAETRSALAQTRVELAEEKADRRKLTDVVADQAAEIRKLKEQLEAKDNPAEGSAVRDRRLSGQDQDESLAEKKPERSRLPSTEAVAAAGAGGGIVESVATHGHLLTTWEGAMATAAVGFGVALYGWGKKKHEAHEERKAAKDADRPED